MFFSFFVIFLLHVTFVNYFLLFRRHAELFLKKLIVKGGGAYDLIFLFFFFVKGARGGGG